MNHIASKRNETTNPVFKGFIVVCLVMLWLVLASPLCMAQITTTGTVRGTVVDPSGSVIQGATVTITQTETKRVTKTVTNGTGNFVQVALDSGHYEVSISSPGFATYRETDIYLGAAATYTVDATLKPGAVADEVTVRGDALQVQTVTAEVSNTISAAEVEDLPLNGRNYQQIASLLPGVVNTSPVGTMGTGGYNTNNSLIVNGGTLTEPGGAGLTGAIYYLDGMWNSSNVVHDQSIFSPNPDSITEVKAMQNNYSAQYTLMGASVFVVQTKSGGNAFHGDAWEFNRNTALNATRYFNAEPTAMNWNIFGYDFGGPLFIPHAYPRRSSKTFFYVNQQFVKQKVATSAKGQSALATMRGQGTPNGDLLFPGTSASPIPGIGGPLGTAWLADPSLPTGKCSSKTNMSSCFKQDANGNWIIPASRVNQNALLMLNAIVPLPNQLGAGGYTAASPASNYMNNSPNITNQSNFQGKIDHEFSPKLRLSGEYMVEQQTFTGGSASRYGTPWANNYDVFGTHNQGGQIRLSQVLSPTMTNQVSAAFGLFNGDHDFGGIHLTSQVPGFKQTLPYSGSKLDGYIPSMVLSQGWGKLGVGSSYVVPRAIELHRTLTDDWSWVHGKHFVQAGGTVFWGTEKSWAWNGTPQGYWTFTGAATGNAMADFLLGIANVFNQGSNGVRSEGHYVIASPYVQDTWKVTRRLSLTGGLRYEYMPWPSNVKGFMVAFDPALYDPAKAPIVSTKGIVTATPGYDRTNGLVINGVNGVPMNLTNAHKNYWAPVVGFAWDIFGNGKTALRGGYGLTYYATAGQGCGQGGCIGYPTIDTINLGVSNFDNPTGSVTPATTPNQAGVDRQNYRATHIHTYSLTFEQELPKHWIMTIAGAGTAMGAGSNSVNINQAPPVTINGVNYDFNPNLNTATGGAYQNSYYAPYQGWGNINYFSNIAFSNWNALEASLKHRFGNLNWSSAFTWSHGLDNYGGWQDNRDLSKAYGNSQNDIPIVFTTSVVYSLPKLQKSRAWVRQLLGGWKYSDMTTIQSGGFNTLSLSTPNNGLATRPDQIAPVTYPGQWRNPLTDYWFDPTSFAKPANGYFGNVRNSTIRVPGIVVFNMAGYKTFLLTERVKLEFRTEFFNAFNHTNPNGPAMGYGSANFGRITGAKEARVGQLSLKVRF